MRPRVLLLLVLALVGVNGCLAPNQPPHAFMPPIAEEYYACDKCGSLHGGIYGKGPLASFASATATRCRHSWRPITRPEFQRFAAEQYPVAWAKTGEYFKRAEPAPERSAHPPS